MEIVRKNISRHIVKMVLMPFLLFIGIYIIAAPKPKPIPPPLSLGQDGHLIYRPDSLGNRVPDYSYCGYKASEKKIPLVPVKVVIPVIEGDATSYIQKAIDYVSSLPANENGFRGAILLNAGKYKVFGRFKISKSGIVIRGSGWGDNGTKIISDGISRETLFQIQGSSPQVDENQIQITTNYVPVNANSFEVESTKGLQVGIPIFITRPSTKDWILALGMKEYGGETDWVGWKPEDHNIIWDRTIIKIEKNKIYINTPLTTALDEKYGGGFVSTYQWPNRVTNVGIENLSLESAYNKENVKDEEHCWNAISFENARDCWVRQVTFKHFAGSAVATYETTSRITVEDCISKEPISEIGGLRRYTFFTSGQQNLIQRCYAESGYHDFATGSMAAGPNAFVQCKSHLPFGFSGAIDSWASGALFDIVNVDGNALSFRNRYYEAQGAGWTAANSMFWQCSAALIECFEPPTTNNWAFGAWSQFAGNGYWYEPNSHVKPRSLFYTQLADRIGEENIPDSPVMNIESEATSSPSIELAAQLVESLQKPIQTLEEFVLEAPQRTTISVDTKNAPLITELKYKSPDEPVFEEKEMTIKNGWLVMDGVVLTGHRIGVPWWNLNPRPRGLSRSNVAITRYVPGRVGKGYTDNLEEVVAEMNRNNIVGIEQNYALWYDRRRDDHERIRRMNGEVWAPFYELPFARSGKELAWDGLSKYDLTKYNLWYWNRLSKYASLAGQNGKVLVHQNYFQHNILEAGAHWVDSPWRTVNNINNTDFPEPPPFAGDKRIFIADRFYDVLHPVRRELHRQYIRQCLNNFKDHSCVIQTTSEEFTGPLHFVEFWLDVIDEWEKESGLNAYVALSTTKDVQDAILKDKKREKVVDIIDIRYWSSRKDGSIYEPPGGVNLAPRQHARKMRRGSRSKEQVYNDVLTYRKMFPNKAVIYSESRYQGLEWGVFMASGSLAPVPRIMVDGFLMSASSMQVDEKFSKEYWTLINDNKEFIIYLNENQELNIDDLGLNGRYNITLINPKDGSIFNSEMYKSSKSPYLVKAKKGDAVVWINKK